MCSVINATKRPKPQDQCYHKTKIKEGPFFFTTTTYGCVFAIVFVRENSNAYQTCQRQILSIGDGSPTRLPGNKNFM